MAAVVLDNGAPCRAGSTSCGRERLDVFATRAFDVERASAVDEVGAVRQTRGRGHDLPFGSVVSPQASPQGSPQDVHFWSGVLLDGEHDQ